jgi:competence protein ComEA
MASTYRHAVHRVAIAGCLGVSIASALAAALAPASAAAQSPPAPPAPPPPRATPEPPRGQAATPTAVQPVHLNEASAAELCALPGIGPAKAARIVAWRQAHGGFRRVKDQRRVRGIGAKTVDRLRPLLTLESRPPAPSPPTAAAAAPAASPRGRLRSAPPTREALPQERTSVPP